jgi:hypothetical protein
MTLDEARDYVKSVNWCFAKTYLSAPHEYTVSSWKPGSQQTMWDFARYIRDNGKVEYFFSRPFIKLTLGEYEYWTMDALIKDTVLVNRTFTDKKRCWAVRQYVNSPAYTHHSRETLLDIEKRMKDEVYS